MTAVPPRHRQQLGLAIAGMGLVLAGLSALLLLGAGQAGNASVLDDVTAIPARVRFMAPEITLSDLSGRQGALDQLRGQVVLVNLWATWCPPCKAEMPAFQAFYDEHRDSGFTVIAINSGESADTVMDFVSDRGLTFPVWLDPTFEAGDVAFRTANLPTSYVIDRFGVVRLMWIGAIDKPTLQQYVVPLIEE